MMKRLFCVALLFVSAPVFAGYCFTSDKRINTCDTQQIQSMINVNDNQALGSAIVFDYEGPSVLVTKVIFPFNAPGENAGQVVVTKKQFKKTATSYEETSKDGCTQKGDYKETSTSIIKTPRAISGNCNSTVKAYFDILKNSPSEYRKINN